jgi:pSer/pThr/pTyr-binding forkhead associated (FHA) protein
VAIVLDSGQRLVIERSLVIGRNPGSGDGHPAHVWPDLSRSVSKRHALLEWSGSELWVTDLDSSTGTRLVSPTGQRQELVAGRRVAARVGTRIELGERSILVAEAVER